MLDSGTTLLLSICVTLAAVAAIICAASLAVASPWWPHRRRHNKTPMGVVYRTIKALAIISPSGPTRHRDSTHRCSVFAESHSLPLRFQHEKLYGSTIPHRSSSRSSISSLYSPNAPSVHRGSIGEMGAASNKVTTVGGYLAPPAMRQRSGSTSLLHDIARRGFEGLTTVPPIPAFMSTVKPQPDSFLADAPTALHNLRSPPGNESHSSIESWTTLQTSEPKKAADVDPETQERRKSLHKARRKTLCSLPQKSVANELGTSLSELASILGTQVSKSSHTSPSRMRNVSSTIRAPSCILPTLSFSGDPAFSVAEAPGGTINYRVFIDATGKDNLAVRVHLYSASNLPSERPWKNSNYVVKAALIGFKSHFVQTSGPVTAACGSPRFSEGNPSVLDFVLDCGMPFNKSDEEIILNLMIIEFAGRKLGDKSVVVATTEYKFSHLTLNGKSTLSTDIRWERCRPSIDVYQLRADVLTSLTHKETEGCLRFEMKEIRNLGFRLVSEDLTLSTGTSRSSRRSSLYPTKLRLRACLVTNGRTTCIRKGFNIRLPTDFADSVVDTSESHQASTSMTNALVLKDHVFSSSELVVTFPPLFPLGLDKQEAFSRAGVRPISWRILAYFVLILEDTAAHQLALRRARAIGCCCLGSNAQEEPTNDSGTRLLSTLATESSQCQVSQWIHVE